MARKFARESSFISHISPKTGEIWGTRIWGDLKVGTSQFALPALSLCFGEDVGRKVFSDMVGFSSQSFSSKEYRRPETRRQLQVDDVDFARIAA